MSEKKKTQEEYKQPKKQLRLFKKRRGGVVLTRDEVREIKAGRKKLRKELRKLGEKDRKEFEITASSMGLYFDKNRFWTLFLWFFSAHGLWMLLALAASSLMVLYVISAVTEMQGHFTISMGDELFKEGFSISEDKEFTFPTSRLFATPKIAVPCISIMDIPENIDEADSKVEGDFFAYTFYLKNEGDKAADYRWEILKKAESQSVSEAAWVMLFQDGEMTFYAKADKDGNPTTVPALDNNSFGYTQPPLYDFATEQEGQYEVVDTAGGIEYWRVKPISFVTEDLLATGVRYNIAPGEVHKYTIVVWLEGDDPDCTNDLIGGHIGLEMHIDMLESGEE